MEWLTKLFSTKTYTTLIPSLFNSTASTLSGSNRSKGDFLNYNELSMYLNRAIQIRAQKVGEVKFYLKKKGTEDIIDDQRNPWLSVLNKPNDYHTGTEFWGLYQKYKDLTGEAYIYIEKDISIDNLFSKDKRPKLHLLRPDLVRKIYSDDYSEIIGYEYTGMNGKNTYSADEILYNFRPDPKKPLEGISLIKAGVLTIDTEVQLSQYHANVLRNGGQVNGVIKFTEKKNAEQIKQAEESYAEKYATARNAGRPLFLSGDADYIKLGLSPSEMAFLETKKATLDDVCVMTGVPRAILSNVTDVKFDNAEASREIFLNETIVPELQNLITFLDWRFIPEEYDLEFTDPTPENQERVLARIKGASEVHAITTNEKRIMLGLEPVNNKEADEILVPFNLTPLEGINEETETKRLKKKSLDEHPLKDADTRKKYAQIHKARLDKDVLRFRKEMRKYFDDQAERLIRSLSAQKQFKKKDLLGELFDESLEIRLAKGMALPLLREMLKKAGDNTFAFVGDQVFGFSFTSDIESYLDSRADIFAHEITDTTMKRLSKTFQESFELGETRPQLIARIQEVYTGFDKSRATTIARTEVNGAAQKGTHEAYKQMGFGIKIWVWGIGVQGGVRDEHVMMDGEEVPINMPFSNGLMFPCDPSGPADEVINCECTA